MTQLRMVDGFADRRHAGAGDACVDQPLLPRHRVRVRKHANDDLPQCVLIAQTRWPILEARVFQQILPADRETPVCQRSIHHINKASRKEVGAVDRVVVLLRGTIGAFVLNGAAPAGGWFLLASNLGEVVFVWAYLVTEQWLADRLEPPGAPTLDSAPTASTT